MRAWLELVQCPLVDKSLFMVVHLNRDKQMKIQLHHSFNNPFNWGMSFAILGTVLSVATPAAAVRLNVSTTNLAPRGNRAVMRPWVGFHQGDFDLFNTGGFIRPSVMPVAMEGRVAPLATTFRDRPSAVMGTPPPDVPPEQAVIQPNETVTQTIEIPDEQAEELFISYATPVLDTSNGSPEPMGQFIANPDPTANPIFDDSGTFMPMEMVITTSQIFEVNGDEQDPTATPVSPDTDQPILRFEITQADDDPEAVPEPTALLGLGAIAGVIGWTKRKTKSTAKASKT